MAEPVEVFACLPATVKPIAEEDQPGRLVVRPAAGQTEFRVGEPVFDRDGAKVGVVESEMQGSGERVEVRLDVDWVNKYVMPGIERCTMNRIPMSMLAKKPNSTDPEWCDLKLIDELLCDALHANAFGARIGPQELEERGGVFQRAAVKRLREAWGSGEMKLISLVWSKYFEETGTPCPRTGDEPGAHAPG